ncbi:MAG: hypothetical protein AAGE92_07210 [Cyanobacteria bacterium P01_G01_bin.4]
MNVSTSVNESRLVITADSEYDLSVKRHQLERQGYVVNRIGNYLYNVRHSTDRSRAQMTLNMLSQAD